MKVTLTECTENPVLSVERAASNCYDSEPSDDGKIMNHCYSSGHQSVLEFADFTFHIEGPSRALLAQLTRHRVASYAVRSQRYCDEDGFEYVTPKTITDNLAAKVKFSNAMLYLQDVYTSLQDMGIPNEDARFVLPNACATVIEVKMNGRELVHFMNERLCTRAQWEIRDLAKAMKKCVENYNDKCKQFAKFFVPKCYKHAKYPMCEEKKCCGLAPRIKDVYDAYLSLKDGESNG